MEDQNLDNQDKTLEPNAPLHAAPSSMPAEAPEPTRDPETGAKPEDKDQDPPSDEDTPPQGEPAEGDDKANAVLDDNKGKGDEEPNPDGPSN